MASSSKRAALSDGDRERYHRHMMIPGWGEEGQERVKSARVFVAGAGGLGSPTAMYLAVSGVGHLVICDCDSPELSNLNRQILHNDSRIGMNKADSAKLTLGELNPAIEVDAISTRIEAENVDDLVGDADIIVDCMDNFPTRYALNECAIRKGIPFVHASVWGLEGKLTFIHVPDTPCLRCIFPSPPAQEVFPVLGATPGMIGCLEAMEALKYLAGVGENVKGQLLVWDGADMEFATYPIKKDPKCPTCASSNA